MDFNLMWNHYLIEVIILLFQKYLACFYYSILFLIFKYSITVYMFFFFIELKKIFNQAFSFLLIFVFM